MPIPVREGAQDEAGRHCDTQFLSSCSLGGLSCRELSLCITRNSKPPVVSLVILTIGRLAAARDEARGSQPLQVGQSANHIR